MKTQQNTLFLSREDVISAGGADMKLAVQDMLHVLRKRHDNRVIQPYKTNLKRAGNEDITGFINIMPVIIEPTSSNEPTVYCCKLIGSMPSNPWSGLPRATGLLILFDEHTKVPLAIMDPQVISAIRTGAVSSVAAKLLIDRRASAAGLIGAGINMRTQLMGLQEALPNLKHVTVYSRGSSKFTFAQEMAERMHIEIKVAHSVRELVQQNRVIVTCIANTEEPEVALFDPNWLAGRTGITIFNIGGLETPLSTVASMDRLICDNWADSKHRGVQSLPLAVKAGLIGHQPIEELGNLLLSGNGRASTQENIFFCPVGMACEDAAIASRVYREAIRKRVGTRLRLWEQPDWI